MNAAQVIPAIAISNSLRIATVEAQRAQLARADRHALNNLEQMHSQFVEQGNEEQATEVWGMITAQLDAMERAGTLVQGLALSSNLGERA